MSDPADDPEYEAPVEGHIHPTDSAHNDRVGDAIDATLANSADEASRAEALMSRHGMNEQLAWKLAGMQHCGKTVGGIVGESYDDDPERR